MTFKLITWNINSVRMRLDLVKRLLDEYQPDLLCLQEIKCQDDQFPAEQIRDAGYPHIHVRGQKAYHGVATISRHPTVESGQRAFCGKGDARHQNVTVDRAGGPLTVHNFYVPAGGDEPDPAINEKFDHKLKFLDEMLELSSEQDNAQNILVGDLNIAPHENDVWSHKQLLKIVSHTPVETEFLDRIRDTGGWTDLVREKISVNERLYSWWSYRARDWRQSDKGRRLDHVWVSPELEDKAISHMVHEDSRGWTKPSDHAPLITEFKF